MGIKGGEWYEKVYTYVCVCKGRCQKKIKDRDFSLSGGGQPHSLSFFCLFLKNLNNIFKLYSKDFYVFSPLNLSLNIAQKVFLWMPTKLFLIKCYRGV